MNKSQDKKAYLLDTNILIGFSIWVPITFNINFWNWLEEALQSGEWILLDVVVGEVKYNRELEEWCEKQKKKGLVTVVSDEVKNRAVKINNIYQMIDETTLKSTVDTYLIAYAEANQLTVCSREAERGVDEVLYKIPDVCKKLHVRVTKRPKEFLRAIGFKN